MRICSYVNEHVFCEHTFVPKFSKFLLRFVALRCTMYSSKGARAPHIGLGNEVTKMSILFQDGSHVDEIFASKLKSLVNGLAKTNEYVSFRLNVQDGESVQISCNHSYACEHMTFMDELDSEILAYGVAIVIATDYRNDSHENTIFVVCDDEL